MSFRPHAVWCGFDSAFTIQNRGVGNDRASPEADAENTSERQVQKSQPSTETRKISNASDDQRHDCSAHDSCAENPRERTVVLGDGIQRQGETEQRTGGKSDQHLAAVEKLEQAHSEEASGRQHSPKPGNCGRSGGVRVITVIQSSAPAENPISTLRLSKSLSRPIPRKHPAV